MDGTHHAWCALLIIFSSLILWPGSTAAADNNNNNNCHDDKQRENQVNYIFYRTLVFYGDGPAILNATREQFKQEWGSCFDLGRFGAKMANFYESYGIDVAKIRQDPYRFHSTDMYDLLPLIYDNDFRLIMTSLYDFSRFMNSPVNIAAWELRFKSPLKNSLYDIPEGSYIFYGAYRLRIHGRDFCLPFHSRTFVGPSSPPYVPLDLTVNSDEWGPGSDRGLITLKTPYTEGFQIRNVLMFPPEKP